MTFLAVPSLDHTATHQSRTNLELGERSIDALDIAQCAVRSMALEGLVKVNNAFASLNGNKDGINNDRMKLFRYPLLY